MAIERFFPNRRLNPSTPYVSMICLYFYKAKRNGLPLIIFNFLNITIISIITILNHSFYNPI